jgi:hypothetical protein
MFCHCVGLDDYVVKKAGVMDNVAELSLGQA